MKEQLKKVMETVENIEKYNENIVTLINERKLKLSMIGVNEVVKTLAELIVLESSMNSMQGLIENDDEGIFILDSSYFSTEIPGTSEILDYLSLDYIYDLSDECVVMKAFVNAIKNQQVTKELLEKTN